VQASSGAETGVLLPEKRRRTGSKVTRVNVPLDWGRDARTLNRLSPHGRHRKPLSGICVVRGSGGEGTQQPCSNGWAGQLLEDELKRSDDETLDLAQATTSHLPDHCLRTGHCDERPCAFCVSTQRIIIPADGVMRLYAEFITVPVFRFFKIGNDRHRCESPTDLKGNEHAKTRTVFVVNAQAVAEFPRPFTSTDASRRYAAVRGRYDG